MLNGIRKSFGYFLVFICLGLDMALMGPTVPSLAGQTGTTIALMGTIFMISAGGFALGTLLGGWLFDWAPARRIMVFGQCIVGALLFLVPHVPTFGLLAALYIVKGIAGGTVHVGVNTLMLWTHGEKSSPFVNALHFFFGLGAFISPFLLGLLIDTGGGYTTAYHLLAVGYLLTAAFLFLRLKPPAPAHAQGGTAKTPPIAAGLLVPLVIAAMLYLFFYVSAEITFGGWIYTYAVKLGLADAAHAAFLTSIFWLFFTAGRLISIPAAVRIAPVRIIPIALAGCAAFLGALILVPDSPAALWIVAAGAGFCMAPVWPSGFTLAGRSVPLTARISGFILLGDSIGGMILPGLTGLIMDTAGAQAMARLVLIGILCTFLAFLGIVVSGRRIRMRVTG